MFREVNRYRPLNLRWLPGRKFHNRILGAPRYKTRSVDIDERIIQSDAGTCRVFNQSPVTSIHRARRLSLINQSPHVHAHRQAHAQKGRKDGGPSLAHERKRNAGDRQETDHHSDIHKNLKENQ